MGKDEDVVIEEDRLCGLKPFVFLIGIILAVFSCTLRAPVLEIIQAEGSGDSFSDCISVFIYVRSFSVRNRLGKCIDFGEAEETFDVFDCNSLAQVPLIADLGSILCVGDQAEETRQGFEDVEQAMTMGLIILSGAFVAALIGLFMNKFLSSRYSVVITLLTIYITTFACIGALFYFSRALHQVRDLPWFRQSIRPQDIPGKNGRGAAQGVIPLNQPAQLRPAAYLVRGVFKNYILSCIVVVAIALFFPSALALTQIYVAFKNCLSRDERYRDRDLNVKI